MKVGIEIDGMLTKNQYGNKQLLNLTVELSSLVSEQKFKGKCEKKC